MPSPTCEECRWSVAIEGAAFGVWDLDPRLDRVHYSPQWKARLGFPRLHAPDSSAFWRCRVHPDDFGPMLRALQLHLDGSEPTYEARFRLRSNGAGYRTMLSRGRVVARDGSGIATRMVGTMVDVSGTPAFRPNFGLAAEGPEPTEQFAHAPFHAVFGAARPRPGSRNPVGGVFEALGAGGAPANHRLADRVGDLLDIALRDASAAR